MQWQGHLQTHNNNRNQGREKEQELCMLWLSPCTTMTAGFCHGHMTVESNDGGWAESKNVNNQKC